MRKKVFGVLQRIGRSFMLPIAVLPIAGMFLGIGSSLTNEATIASLGMESILGYGTILNQILTLLMAVGQTIFDNLPLIFAASVASGMAKKSKEVAVLSSIIAFFVMHSTIHSLLTFNGVIYITISIKFNYLIFYLSLKGKDLSQLFQQLFIFLLVF